MAVRTVLVVPVTGAPYTWTGSLTLERMQELVRGESGQRSLIEGLSLGNGQRIYCNEEGLLYGMPYNAAATTLARALCDPEWIEVSALHFVGPCFFVTEAPADDEEGIEGSVSDWALDLAGLS